MYNQRILKKGLCQKCIIFRCQENGYGQVSYLRHIDESGLAYVLFIMEKSRAVPLKQISVPRLVLTAALVSARVSQFLNMELQCNVMNIHWTDSKVVLGYINNDSK